MDGNCVRSAIYLNSGSWLVVEMNQNFQLRKIRANNNHSRYGGKMRRPPRRMQATANNQSKAIKAMLFAASSGGKFLATLAVICLLLLVWCLPPWTIIKRPSSNIATENFARWPASDSKFQDSKWTHSTLSKKEDQKEISSFYLSLESNT